jgi:hypothetical protein
MEMNENPYINDVSRSGATGMSGFMLGAIVGAGVALLFAPATGTDTRRRVGDTVKKLGSAARDRIQEGTEQVKNRFESGRQGIEGGRQGFESGRQGSPGIESRPGGDQFGQGRREPVVPSTGAPGQTGSRTTPGKTPQGSTYTP